MKKTILLLMLFFGCFTFAQQVPQTYLYTFNPFLVNPATSGMNNCLEVSVDHHNQWVKIEGAPITNHLTLSSRLGNNWGVGGQFMMDKIGMLQQVSAMGNVSYGFLSGDQRLRVGLSLGYNNYRVNPSAAIAFDLSDPIVNGGNQSAGNFSSDFGLYYKKGNLELYGSVKQWMKTYANFGILNSQGYAQRAHFVLGSGYNVTLNEQWKLRPNVWVKNIKNVTQADVNVDAQYHEFLQFGIGLRTQVGLVARAGITLKEKFFFGYAYEAPLANISTYSTGSHEMMLKMTLCRPTKSPKVKKITKDSIAQVPPKENAKIDTLYITKTEYRIDTVFVERPIEVTPPQLETTEENQAVGNLSKTILFEFDKSLVKKESYGEIENLVNMLQMNPKLMVSLEGHTDAKGPETYNANLSKNRVNAVRDLLIFNGIAANRISIGHFGESKPKASNDTVDGRKDNRRVDVVIIKKD
ncbi:MAG: type IX secretion system membrane protein PorP/SprF [Flavobacteriia bacterium]|nr:type IX secretion system membrane protein PorP/SprF [Flavobacteriia bacterium]